MGRFVTVDRSTDYLLPPSVEDWLPSGHVARFVVEIVERLDLSALEGAYASRGSDAHHPAVLLGLLIYGYITGVYSSRAIERATYDSIAFRYIAANTYPDHDTINTFRGRFLKEIEALFVQVLEIAAEMKLLNLGTISLDGTKIKANASRHSAVSHGHAKALRERLREEVAELMRRAQVAEAIPDHVSLPKEIERRQSRVAALDGAIAKIEAQAKELDVREQAEFEAKQARREALAAEGKKPRGPDPKPPQSGPRDSDQLNLTDEESRIMPAAGGGFDQAYNAQAAVDAESLLIVGRAVTQATNDRQQVEPMVAELQTLPESVGSAQTLLGDAGYFSRANAERCVAAGIEPLFAMGRETHHWPLAQRLREPPSAPPADADAITRMKHTLRTPDGRSRYAQRKCTVEPVFGIIKQAMRFRQFLLRGLAKVTGEWNLVCMAWNIKRMAVLSG
ncbi:MAG TPA: IS1182 family transposase [Burkholderiaceae bacterium]|nr:IS1182 family transposase [Burkholderiaceae bacterium]